MPFLYFCAKKINQPKSYIMKTNLTLLSAALVAAISPLHCHAQELPDSALQERTSQLEILPYPSEGTESPRGVYKLTYMRDKHGNLIQGPFDQYKICTDSVTLMLNVQGNRFTIGKTDNTAFNYTGETPDAHLATATRIFDSNAKHFTLKWWSDTPGHLYFPHNDWCTEYYESGQYSENGKKIFDALMAPPAHDPKNPLIGTWRLIGMMDELRNTKKELKRIRENPIVRAYTIFTPHYIVAISRNTGSLFPSPNPYNKKVFKVGKNENKITWLSPDLIAIEIRQDYRADYEILERVTHGTAFDDISSYYTDNRQRTTDNR